MIRAGECFREEMIFKLNLKDSKTSSAEGNSHDYIVGQLSSYHCILFYTSQYCTIIIFG